ncbi:MAG TPA: hypothetical protein VM684_09145, partial [Gaiellales bacterium]|nr:hypothetical protein [Gaiellales bacterium]
MIRSASTQAGRCRHDFAEALGLLLGAYIWGTGPSAFLVGRRARTFTRTDIDEIGQRLQAVDRLLASEGPIAAYASLTRGAPNSIRFLGP